MTTLVEELHAKWRAENEAREARMRAKYWEPVFGLYGRQLRAALEQEAAPRPTDETRGDATHRLRLAHERLQRHHYKQAFDEDAIRHHAENYARLASRIPTLTGREAFALTTGISPPEGRTITAEGAALRLADPLWWRRQLRKAWTRDVENTQRDLGLIRKGKAPYASDEAVQHRRAQRRKMREFLERHAVENELSEQLPLVEVADRSLANPALRRGEFMCRVRGFERIAENFDHVALFVTVTAPSAFHAQLAVGGANPAFDRKVVRDAQAWLCRMWARSRAKLKRLSILTYGFRVAEPHHDATPHWHLLLFVAQRHVDALHTVIRECYLGEYADERGARDHRTKFETIDKARGSATGYLAKYISKNIDGKGAIAHERDTETDGTITDSLARVDAWAACHGIRQFQQIGGPPVGLYREARRLRDRVADPDIERARDRADRGDFCGFTQCVGGIHAGRRTNIRLERCETGQRNRYAEARPPAVIGLRCASAVSLTRHHAWRIVRRGPCSGPRSGSPSYLGPVALTVRHGNPSAWTNPNETSRAGPI